MSLLLFVGQTAPLLGNPTGGAVVAGGATIGAAGPTLTINQSTQSAIINWQTFSIANGETTKFIVPNSGAATLNRVVGGNPSAIYGNLQSNGILYLVNPSGIVVGPNGRIDTAGFMASTLDVSNEQFLKGGDLTFAGTSDAAINNAGTIHASTGDVYLIANQVNNTGTISAPQGSVGLAAGNEVLFQQAGNQHLFVQATPAGTKRATGVTNAGTIRAAAAELKAAGGNAYALAINNTGVIAATGYKKVNGQVYLTSDGGSITNSGKISAKQANGNGGTIALTGTSSTTTASKNTVTNSGTLNVSATKAGGTGGTISVKNMTGATIHSGALLAQGGQGGAGGDAEVSGNTVGFTGTVDLTASGGETGNLLLDPATLDVISTTGGGTIIGGQNDPTSSTISNITVDDALGTANITLNADNSITIDGFIQWLSSNILTLSTNHVGSTITFNNSIGAFNNGGSLVINTAGANDAITGPGGFEVSGTFTLQSGAFFQGAADVINNNLPTFAAGGFSIGTNASFLRVTGGDGLSAATAYQVADIYGLQGLAGANFSGADIKLVHNIDATTTVGWNSGQGFLPLAATTPYTGTFNGQGFTIDGLTIDEPTTSAIGLFGQVGSGASISNLLLTNAAITGKGSVGALIGQNNGGTISNISIAGTVTGSQTHNIGDEIGGLVGENDSGSISNIKSSAAVTGADEVGGLVGYNNGSITSAVTTGSTTASGSTDGGLVGFDDSNSSVTSSTNTGAVSGGGVNVGGLVGYNRGIIRTSFNSGSVSSLGGAVGGLVGDNDNINSSPGTISDSYSIGTVTGAGANPTGGLVGLNFGTITNSYSTGLVGGSSSTGGLVQSGSGTITGSFWDTTTSGQPTSGGGTGLATSALLQESTYSGAGWSIGTDLTADTWVIFDGQTRPILAAAYSTTITDAHQLQLIGLNATTLAANYIVANNIDLSGTLNPADVWGTSTTNNGSGFVPDGNNSSYYTGTFNGQSFTIDRLYINRPTSDEVGLFGVASGTIENVSLTNVQVTGADVVGGLVGSLGNPASANQSTGTLTLVSSSGSVTGGGNYVGGLAGLDHGNLIASSYTTGTVSGGSFVGGLIGSSLSAVMNTFSTANVTASGGVVGGLDGEIFGNSVVDSYSMGTVSGNSETGAFVGRNLSAMQGDFYDTTITGALAGVGNGSSSNLVGATTANLKSEAFINANAPLAPQWDFVNVWTTNGDTTTPQLIGLAAVAAPSGSTSTLSGTAYTDAGVTTAPINTFIDLIFNGVQLGSTTTNSSGGFTFSNVSVTDLSSGVLLTDANDQGNAYYQANSPAATIAAVDLWGGTLRVMADTASNAALKTVAGSLSGSGINFGVNGANVLSTTAGIDVSILSGYTFDGNITAGGAFYTANTSVLTSTQDVTLTGTRSSLSGSLASTAAVNLTSTAGDVVLINLGTSNTPATAGSMTLTSAGAVSMGATDLTLNGGNFTVTGVGSSSDLNGVDLQGCNIITNGGNISLTGHSITQFNAQLGGLVAGKGIDLANSVLTTAPLNQSTPTSGNITLIGNASPGAGLSVVNNLDGVAIDGTTLNVINGALSITGTVSNGTTATYSNPVDIFNTSVVQALGNGTVSITGTSVGATASTNISGVRIDDASVLAGNASGVPVSGISIIGTAGTIANATLNAGSVGIYAFTTSTIAASGSAPITMTGTGGTDTTTDPALNTFSSGIFLSSQASGITSEIGTNSGALTLTGIGGVSPRFSSGLNIYGPLGGTAKIDSVTGSITIDGSLVNAPNPSTGLFGVDLQVGSVVSSVQGNIIIDGQANHGAATGGTAAQSNGVLMSQSTVQTLNGGSITIIGDTTGMTGNYQIGGILAYQSTISDFGGVLTITGTTSTTSAVADELFGIIFRGATNVTATNAALTLTGNVNAGTAGMRDFGVRVSEGSVVSAPLGLTVNGSTVGSIGQGIDTGVVVEGAGSQIRTLSTGTPVLINGHSGALTGTTGAVIDIGGDNVSYHPGTYGILVSDGGAISTPSALTLIGTSGANSNSDPTSSAAAIAVFSPVVSETTTVSAGGLLTFSGASLTLGGANNVGTIAISSATAVLLSTPVGTTTAVNAPITSALSLAGGAFDLELVNNATFANVSVSSLEIEAAGFNVDLGTTTTPSLTINGAGAITQSGALDTSLLSISNAAQVTLTDATNVIASLGAVNSGGGFDFFTDPGLTLTNTVTSGGPITIAETGGPLTIAPTGSVIETGTATIILAAGTDLANSNYFINQAGANAVQTGSFGRFFLFSSDPMYDNLGGITFAPANMVYNAIYPTSATSFSGGGNAEFFYVAGMGQVGPNSPANSMVPNTTTGGAAGGGSNIVPVVLTTQNSDVAPQGSVDPATSLAQVFPQIPIDGTPGNAPNYLPNGGANADGTQPPAFSFTGTGVSQLQGQNDGGLANSTSNSGQVIPGDTAQLGNGQYGNASNPQAADVLNEALGPIVYANLAEALKSLGDWADVPDAASDPAAGSGETILTGGDVAEMTGTTAKKIPLSQAPEQLQNAMKDDSLKGAGHP